MSAPLRAPGAAVRRVIGDPAGQDSLLMLASSAVTAVLGLAYWSLAARVLSPTALSVGSAWTAALVTVSSIGQLNLFALLPAVLPAAGPSAGRLVRRSYLAGLVATVVIAAGYALVLRDVVAAPFHVDALVAVVAFAASGALWTAFSLQDSVAVGVRATWWVPVENGAVSLLKIGLLAALARDLQAAAVVISTIAPLLVAVPVMSLALARRLGPRTAAAGATATGSTATGATATGQPANPLAGVGRLAVADWAGFVLSLVASSYLPVLVVAFAGPAPAAAFVTIWAVFGAVDVALGMVVVAMTVHVARSPQRSQILVRQTAARLAGLATMGLVVVVVAGRPLLEWYSPRYAEDGWPLLVVLLVGSLPRVVPQLTVGLARAMRRPGVILTVQGVSTTAVIVGMLVAIPVWGVLGAAGAWAGAQLVAALVAVPLLRRLLPARAHERVGVARGEATPGTGGPRAPVPARGPAPAPASEPLLAAEQSAPSSAEAAGP